MRPANDDFENNGFIRDVPALHVNCQVGQRFHQLLVERADSTTTFIVFVPGLVIMPRGVAKGIEHTFQVVLVLQPDMLVDDRNASRAVAHRMIRAFRVCVSFTCRSRRRNPKRESALRRCSNATSPW